MSGSIPRDERTTPIRSGAGAGTAGPRVPGTSGTGGPAIPNAPQAATRNLPGSPLQPLIGVLDQVERAIGRDIRSRAVAEATEQANAEPLRRGEDGRLEIPDLSPGWFETPRAEATRRVMANRYANEMAVGFSDDLLARRARFPGNPDGFIADAARWREGTVGELPAGVRQLVGQRLDAMIGEHAASLAATGQQQQTAQALRTLNERVSRDATDAMDLGSTGRDAAPARERVVGAIVAARVQGVIDPAEADARLRRHLVVEPQQALLRQRLRTMDPTAAIAVTGLLASGAPGQPGWDEGWTGLSAAERRAVAEAETGAVGVRRQAQQWAQADGDRRNGLEAGRIVASLTGLWEDRANAAPLTAAQLVQQNAAMDRLRAINPQTWAAMRNRQSGEERQGRGELLNEMLAGDDRAAAQALAALGVSGPVTQNANARMREIEAEAGRLPLSEQGRLWADMRRELESEARQQAALGQRLGAYGLALAGGAQVSNSPENQQIQEATLVARGVATFTEPHAARAVAQQALTGVLSQRVVSFLAYGAFSSPDTFRAATRLHETISADPIAHDVYQRNVPDNVRAALSGAAEMVATMTDDAQVRRVMDQARARQSGNGITREAVMARLGVTAAEQERRATELTDTALTAQFPGFFGRLVGGAGIPGGSAAGRLPPGMQRQLRDTLISNMAIFEATDAARNAVAQTMQNWTASRLSAPSAEDDVARPALAQDTRWVRNSADRLVAPYGRGGASNTNWQQPYARTHLRDQGFPESFAYSVDLGVNAFWQHDPAASRQLGAPRWRLQMMTPEGVLRVVGEVVGGRESSAPMLFDLITEQARHRERWRAEHGPATRSNPLPQSPPWARDGNIRVSPTGGARPDTSHNLNQVPTTP